MFTSLYDHVRCSVNGGHDHRVVSVVAFVHNFHGISITKEQLRPDSPFMSISLLLIAMKYSCRLLFVYYWWQGQAIWSSHCDRSSSGSSGSPVPCVPCAPISLKQLTVPPPLSHNQAGPGPRPRFSAAPDPGPTSPLSPTAIAERARRGVNSPPSPPLEAPGSPPLWGPL